MRVEAIPKVKSHRLNNRQLYCAEGTWAGSTYCYQKVVPTLPYTIKMNQHLIATQIFNTSTVSNY